MLRQRETVWVGGDHAIQRGDGAQWGASGAWRSGLLDLDPCAPDEEANAIYGAKRAPTGAHLVLVPSLGVAGETTDRAILAVHVTRLQSLDALGALSPSPPATTLAAGAGGELLTLTATAPWRNLAQVDPGAPSSALAVTLDPGSGVITVDLETDAGSAIVSTLQDVVNAVNALTGESSVTVAVDAADAAALAVGGVESGYIVADGYAISQGVAAFGGPYPLQSPYAPAGVIGDGPPADRIAQALLTHTHYLGDLGPELMRHGVAGLDLATLAGGARYVAVVLQWLWPHALQRESGPDQHYWTACSWPMQITLSDGPGPHSRMAERRPFVAAPLTAAGTAAALASGSPSERSTTIIAPGDNTGCTVRIERFAAAAAADDAFAGSAEADARDLFVVVRAAGPGGMAAGESINSANLSAIAPTSKIVFTAGVESVEVWAAFQSGSTGAKVPYAVSVTWHGPPSASGGGGGR